jgi:hypothetical protein
MTYQLQPTAARLDSVQFVRPAHGLVALHGAEVVPVTALGLSAGRATHGHRFEAARDPSRSPTPTATPTRCAAGRRDRQLRRAPRRDRRSSKRLPPARGQRCTPSKTKPCSTR